MLEPVVEVQQAETALALELAEAYYDAWQTPRTLTLLGKLHTGHPDNPEVLAALFRARKAAHRHQEALDALEELIRRAPDDLALLDHKAELLQQLGRYPELEHLLDDLARREPGSAVRQYRLGLALAQWSARPDRTLGARQAFESAIRLDPEHAESYYRLGLIQQAGQQIEASVASFRRCLDLAPRSLDAMKGLARSYALQGDRPREREWLEAYRVLKKVRDEEDHLKMAATLRRPTPAENRALGLFHLRHVRYEQAVAQLESAEHGGGLSSAERRTLSALYGHLRRFQRMSELRAGT